MCQQPDERESKNPQKKEGKPPRPHDPSRHCRAQAPKPMHQGAKNIRKHGDLQHGAICVSDGLQNRHPFAEKDPCCDTKYCAKDDLLR